MADVCRTHNISPQSFHRWKQKYGGMGLSEAQRLRDLEKENTELKKLLADQLLKARALEIALEKKPKPGAPAPPSHKGGYDDGMLRARSLPVAGF